MDINTKIHRTLGPKAADFILRLYDDGKSIFTVSEAAIILKLKDQGLQNFLGPLVKKGILTRLIPGLYSIVPFELGNARGHMANPYVIAREIVRHKFKTLEPKYYISYSSALELHQMVTQPQLVVYVTVPQQIKQKFTIMGTEFRFVTCKKSDFFGLKKNWVDKSEMIYVSDVEKTIIDGLNIPEYCGGITEVAKGLWMKRHDLSPERLLEYAEKMDKGAIYRRLGFLLEIYKMDCPAVIQKLQGRLTDSYQLLDPTLLNEGKYFSRWKIRVNITEQEFLSVVRT